MSEKQNPSSSSSLPSEADHKKSSSSSSSSFFSSGDSADEAAAEAAAKAAVTSQVSLKASQDVDESSSSHTQLDKSIILHRIREHKHAAAAAANPHSPKRGEQLDKWIDDAFAAP